VGESAVRAVFDAESSVVRIVYAHAGFVILEMISTLRVAGRSMQIRALVSFRAEACRLVVLGTINVCTIIKRSIAFANGPSSALILEMPVEARKRPVLLTFVLEKQRTLFDAKLLEILFQQFLFAQQARIQIGVVDRIPMIAAVRWHCDG